ncbi:restriction endonuclease subunit S [Iodobacter fluviatilis]|uniref:EcoKI restriction-modification system protein HsdS n=1 Tax=Iodobacter fluviatilis TaxID=537 RepID=A0A377Q2S8_9NEIS|nr:restriction endonuclease subunit S [Iodobacter fluviatilis]TCU90100.1 type I restriction enzyme S subunit [Iodobacter fluviatilis]STQ89127.1 EcoKI restriction-modification system protein HsdS [Iodobacter fluviatilis]
MSSELQTGKAHSPHSGNAPGEGIALNNFIDNACGEIPSVIAPYGAEWIDTTLGEICALQKGAIQTGPFGSQLHASDYVEVGIPVVMPANIGAEGGISEDGIARIQQADADRLAQHKLQIGDVIFSRRGDVTRNALVEPHQVGWLCGTGCLKVRLGNESKADAKFISYCLRLPETKEWLIRHAVGATMPNLNTSILSSVPVTVPPLAEQKKITTVLRALDDRIVLLRETNATLESMAQALFKSWFVDFDPVHANAQSIANTASFPSDGVGNLAAPPDSRLRGNDGLLPLELQALFPATFTASPQGLVPEGWSIGKVEDLLELAYGKALKATDRIDGDIPVYGSGGITGSHNQALVNGPSVIVGRKGTVGSLYWEDRPFFPIDTVFYVKTSKPLSYCFYLLQTLGLHDMNTDGAVPGLNRNNVYRLPVVIPSDAVFNAFDETAAAIRETIFTNSQQAQTLATLRDTLLPRLISGQLRLPEAEALLMEAVV